MREERFVISDRSWEAIEPLTNFTTTPAANTSEGYRLVLVFSGDRYRGATSICRNIDSASLKPAVARVELQGVLLS